MIPEHPEDIHTIYALFISFLGCIQTHLDKFGQLKVNRGLYLACLDAFPLVINPHWITVFISTIKTSLPAGLFLCFWIKLNSSLYWLLIAICSTLTVSLDLLDLPELCDESLVWVLIFGLKEIERLHINLLWWMSVPLVVKPHHTLTRKYWRSWPRQIMGRYGRIMDLLCSVVLGDCRVLKHSTYKFTFRKTAADSAPLAVLYSEVAEILRIHFLPKCLSKVGCFLGGANVGSKQNLWVW